MADSDGARARACSLHRWRLRCLFSAVPGALSKGPGVEEGRSGGQRRLAEAGAQGRLHLRGQALWLATETSGSWTFCAEFRPKAAVRRRQEIKQSAFLPRLASRLSPRPVCEDAAVALCGLIFINNWVPIRLCHKPANSEKKA